MESCTNAVTITNVTHVTINQESAITMTIAHEPWHCKQYRDRHGKKYKENSNPAKPSEWNRGKDKMEDGEDNAKDFEKKVAGEMG